MRIEQIEAFVKTAENGSFANAAIALGMRRSTVSAAVSALEDELAIHLFQRSGNSLQITPIAQSLLADSQRLLQSANRIRQLSNQHLEGIESSGPGDRKRFKPVHTDLSYLPAKGSIGHSEPDRSAVFRPYDV